MGGDCSQIPQEKEHFHQLGTLSLMPGRGPTSHSSQLSKILQSHQRLGIKRHSQLSGFIPANVSSAHSNPALLRGDSKANPDLLDLPACVPTLQSPLQSLQGELQWVPAGLCCAHFPKKTSLASCPAFRRGSSTSAHLCKAAREESVHWRHWHSSCNSARTHLAGPSGDVEFSQQTEIHLQQN